MKVFKIDSCSKCPSLSALTNIVGTYNVCHLEMRKIGNNLDIIQHWCPLEDYKEAKSMKIDDSEIQKLNRIYDFKQKNEENKIEYEKDLEEEVKSDGS